MWAQISVFGEFDYIFPNIYITLISNNIYFVVYSHSRQFETDHFKIRSSDANPVPGCWIAEETWFVHRSKCRLEQRRGRRVVAGCDSSASWPVERESQLAWPLVIIGIGGWWGAMGRIELLHLLCECSGRKMANSIGGDFGCIWGHILWSSWERFVWVNFVL